MQSCGRPKVLSRIKEDKSAAKEQLKAVAHIIQQLDFSLDDFKPIQPLRPLDPAREVRSLYEANGLQKPFLCENMTGLSVWDYMDSALPLEHKRLSLCADEGSTLYTAYQYLCSQGFCVILHRDALRLG